MELILTLAMKFWMWTILIALIILGFTDRAKAVQSINKIKGSGKTHAHKMQAAIAMSQRAKVASQRAKDPEKKKDLASAHRAYQSYINQNKKSKD